ncbi:MAG: YolD-like family protein [Bacillota bacterium]
MKDRGNKLYEGHRFILPEFKKRMVKTTEPVPVKPHLDYEALVEIELLIRLALARGDIVRVKVWTGKGIEEKVGLIVVVDMATKQMKMETAGGRLWVKYDNVTGIGRE